MPSVLQGHHAGVVSMSQQAWAVASAAVCSAKNDVAAAGDSDAGERRGQPECGAEEGGDREGSSRSVQVEKGEAAAAGLASFADDFLPGSRAGRAGGSRVSSVYGKEEEVEIEEEYQESVSEDEHEVIKAAAAFGLRELAAAMAEIASPRWRYTSLSSSFAAAAAAPAPVPAPRANEQRVGAGGSGPCFASTDAANVAATIASTPAMKEGVASLPPPGEAREGGVVSKEQASHTKEGGGEGEDERVRLEAAQAVASAATRELEGVKVGWVGVVARVAWCWAFAGYGVHEVLQ